MIDTAEHAAPRYVRSPRMLAQRAVRQVVFAAMIAAASTLAPHSNHNPFTAAAQASQRIIMGHVIDASDAKVSGAIVYLKDTKSLGVKSFISTEDGSFRFGQIATGVDYEVWAEHNGAKSPVKAVSSFDNKKQFDFTLKLK